MGAPRTGTQGTVKAKPKTTGTQGVVKKKTGDAVKKKGANRNAGGKGSK